MGCPTPLLPSFQISKIDEFFERYHKLQESSRLVEDRVPSPRSRMGSVVDEISANRVKLLRKAFLSTETNQPSISR